MSLIRKKIIPVFGLLVTIIIIGVALSFINGGALRRACVAVGGQTIYVEVADTPEERARGLSSRRSIGANEGMLFVFDSPGSYGFWMKDMNFSIDIVWIQDDEIVGFEENVQPVEGKSVFGLKIYHPPEPVNKVLEVKAGMVKKYGFQAGDIIVIQ